MTLWASDMGFRSATAGGGAETISSARRETNPNVSASLSPSSTAAARARARESSRPPTSVPGRMAGSTDGIDSSPRTRDPSTTSTSRVTSGRCVGPRAPSPRGWTPRPQSRGGRPRRRSPPARRARRGAARCERGAPARTRRHLTRDGDAHVRDRASARERLHQRRRSAEGALGVSVIDAALEAVARLGVQPVAPRRAPHAPRIEERALEEHAGRRGADLRVGSAHHAGQRDRPLAVADEEIVLVQPALGAVERGHRLAGARRAPRCSPCARGQMKACIGWPYSSITQLVTSTTLEMGARRAPPRSAPQRRRADGDAEDRRGAVVGATLAVGDAHADERVEAGVGVEPRRAGSAASGGDHGRR